MVLNPKYWHILKKYIKNKTILLYLNYHHLRRNYFFFVLLYYFIFYMTLEMQL